MKKEFNVLLHDKEMNYTTCIDTIEADENYTPEEYLEDCDANGCDWGLTEEQEIIFEEVKGE